MRPDRAAAPFDPPKNRPGFILMMGRLEDAEGRSTTSWFRCAAELAYPAPAPSDGIQDLDPVPLAQSAQALYNLARNKVAPAQLSQSPEQRSDKRPMASDLRESGAIEQGADVVIFLYWDDYYDENSDKRNVAELNVAKQRNGPQETIEAYFGKQTTLFNDLAYRTFSPNGKDRQSPTGRGKRR